MNQFAPAAPTRTNDPFCDAERINDRWVGLRCDQSWRIADAFPPLCGREVERSA